MHPDLDASTTVGRADPVVAPGQRTGTTHGLAFATAGRRLARLRAVAGCLAFAGVFALTAPLAPLTTASAAESEQEASTPVLRVYTDYV